MLSNDKDIKSITYDSHMKSMLCPIYNWTYHALCKLGH